MITLFGATGYTGRLIAHELANLELSPGSIRIAGRSAEKLAALAEELPYKPEWITADTRQPQTLKALFEGTRVLVNTVGPFTDMGERVVSLAAAHGVHYLDTTNELGYVHRMQSYDALARQTGAAIVPACGFEVAFSDCMAAVLAEEFEGSLDKVEVIYGLSGGNSSLGTRQSAVRSLGTSWLGYRDGKWARQVPCSELRWFNLPRGERLTLSFPSSEATTLPRHLDVKEVGVWMAVSRKWGNWAAFVLPTFACMARGPLGKGFAKASTLFFRPGGKPIRSQSSFLVQVEVSQGEKRRRMQIAGKGTYEHTAKVIAYAVSQMAKTGYCKAGVLTPAQALEPRDFLKKVEDDWGLDIKSL